MKKDFPGYYRPTPEAFKEMWDTCLFVLDTSVLLDLHDLDADTRDKLFKILDHVSDRLWFPHQVALEYHHVRLMMIRKQAEKREQPHRAYLKAQSEFQKQLHILKSSLSDGDRYVEQLDGIFSSIQEELPNGEWDADSCLLNDDYLADDILALLRGAVGPAYTRDRLQEIFREGDLRFALEIPPGYIDSSKTGYGRYGDLLVWFQMIDKAKSERCPIILVTNEKKEDWWWKSGDRLIAPHPKLVQEMLEEASEAFYMYPLNQFMKHASDYLDLVIDQDVVDELDRLEQRREDRAEDLEGTAKDIYDLLSYIKRIQDIGYVEPIWNVPASVRVPHIETIPASVRAIQDVRAIQEMGEAIRAVRSLTGIPRHPHRTTYSSPISQDDDDDTAKGSTDVDDFGSDSEDGNQEDPQEQSGDE